MGIPERYVRPALLVPALCVLYYFHRYRSLPYLILSIPIYGVFLFLYAYLPTLRGGKAAKAAFFTAAAGLALLGLWQFLQLQDPGDGDHAAYSCALWNMARGNPYYSINDMNFFGTHADYTGLLWIPVQALTGEWGLKIGECFCLLLAAWLALRRFRDQPEIAYWGGAALLLTPAIASQFFNGFHLEFLAAPFLVLALDAYRENRLKAFLAYTAFLAYSKEVFTLAIAGVLLVAVLERRPWKWILLPGLLCCAQMAAYWFLILPRFAPQGNELGGLMPHSLGQVVAQWLRSDTLYYALQLMLPFLPLALALPKRYLLLPLPLMLFYAGLPFWIFGCMTTHYAYPAAILCFGGFILADKELLRPHGRTLLACAVTALLSFPIWRLNLTVPAPDFPRVRAVERMHALVPDSASVAINAPFMARFAARRDASDWYYRKKPAGDFDFVLVDRAFTPEFHATRARLDKDIDSLGRSPDWAVAYSRGDLFLFRNLRR